MKIRCPKCSSEDVEDIDGYHWKCKTCGHFFDRTELEMNETQKEHGVNGW